MSNDRPLTGDNPKPWFKKKRFVIPIALLVLGVIGGATGGNKSSTSPAATTSSSAKVATSNPLATGDNKTACSSMRFIYAENSGVLSDWSKQAATDADAGKAMQKIGQNFTDIGSTASGAVQKAMTNAGLDYKKMYVALSNGDSTALGTDLAQALADATTFDNVCKSIGVNQLAKNIYTIAIVKGKKKTTTNIQLDEEGFTLGTFRTKETHRWDSLKELELDGPDNVNSRITATRLLTLGVFALAAKKKTGESYAFITLADGSPVVIEFPKTSHVQLKAIFAPYMSKISTQAIEEKPAQSSAEQLKEFASLLEQELISQEDYDAAKKQILGL